MKLDLKTVGVITPLLLLCAASAARAQQELLPAGEGKETVVRLCSQCHSLRNLLIGRQTRDLWQLIVEDMAGRGWSGTDDDIKIVIDYLVAHFGMNTDDSTTKAASEVEAPRESSTKPFPPLRIVGNLYYVGTYNLASYLITTADGNILINTGPSGSVPMIRSNIESLGFKFDAIKLLLATHAHEDHVAGLAKIKRLTGAKMLMQEGDSEMLEDGGSSDYRFPHGRIPVYEPVKVDQKLKDGDKIRFGGTELTVHHHPGHTKGATSFTFTTHDSGRSYRVLIVSMGTLNEGVKLLDVPGYPKIVQDYARTFAKQKHLSADVWVSSDADHFGLHEKYKPGDPYDPRRFADPEGYRAGVRRYEELYLNQLQRERQERSK
jgi:metallo-beta-lactamase class B